MKVGNTHIKQITNNSSTITSATTSATNINNNTIASASSITNGPPHAVGYNSNATNSNLPNNHIANTSANVVTGGVGATLSGTNSSGPPPLHGTVTMPTLAPALAATLSSSSTNATTMAPPTLQTPTTPAAGAAGGIARAGGVAKSGASAIAQANAAAAKAAAAAKEKEKKTTTAAVAASAFYPQSTALSMASSMYGDDDINDVAAMGGVNLAEESQRILGSTELIGTQIRSCKDEIFLHLPALQAKIRQAMLRHGLEEPGHDVAVLISHAAQERLKNIVEKLAVIAEHRIDIIKVSVVGNVRACVLFLSTGFVRTQVDPRYEVTKDVRGQIKFLEELDKAEQKRHEEQEREMLMRAAKSRSKNEDAEHMKLKAKVCCEHTHLHTEKHHAINRNVHAGQRNATRRNGGAPATRRQLDSVAGDRTAQEASTRYGCGHHIDGEHDSIKRAAQLPPHGNANYRDCLSDHLFNSLAAAVPVRARRRHHCGRASSAST